MSFDFMFWFFLVGILVATMQDLKRREVDNWLNLFLLFGGFVYIFFGAVLAGDFSRVFVFFFLLGVVFLIMNAFYYGRVFAGGDAKLLFSMTPFFAGATFISSLADFGIWILFLMVSGSIYGLFYSGVLWWKNRVEVNREIGKVFREKRMFLFAFLAIVFMTIFGRFNEIFFIIGGCLLVFPFLYSFAKGLENVSMVRAVRGSELREGDWLVEDVKVGRKTVLANWDGLSLEEIRLLKNKKKVLIKEGLPFVPAFLIGFVLYFFFRDWFLGFLF